MNSGSWWWTGRPGVLQFMGSQRVGHDWATDLNLTEVFIVLASFSFCSNRAMNCPHKLGWGMVETGILMLLLVSPEDSMFVYWLCWALICCTWNFSSCSKQKWLSSYLCTGFSLLGLLLLQNTGFRAQAQYLCCTGLDALRHVVSSQTRDQTWVLCIGR